MKKEQWLDNQDVMLMLHISRRALQTWRDNSILPFTKIGGKILYRMSDVQRILYQNYNGRKEENS